MATLTETMSVFRMPSRYICNAFFRARLFLSKLEMILWKFRMTHAWIEMFRFFFRLELKMPSLIWECLLGGFYECLHLELEMPLVIWECFSKDWKCFSRFENAFRRIGNASRDLRMLFERLKMLLTLWERFSKNWKCFSWFENAFRKIENASHALRTLFEELKMPRF
jgi:hypothetical protein